MQKTEKIKDFKKMKKEELSRILVESQEKLRRLRFDLTEGKIKNVKGVRSFKKDIARMKTVLAGDM